MLDIRSYCSLSDELFSDLKLLFIYLSLYVLKCVKHCQNKELGYFCSEMKWNRNLENEDLFNLLWFMAVSGISE